MSEELPPEDADQTGGAIPPREFEYNSMEYTYVDYKSENLTDSPGFGTQNRSTSTRLKKSSSRDHILTGKGKKNDAVSRNGVSAREVILDRNRLNSIFRSNLDEDGEETNPDLVHNDINAVFKMYMNQDSLTQFDGNGKYLDPYTTYEQLAIKISDQDRIRYSKFLRDNGSNLNMNSIRNEKYLQQLNFKWYRDHYYGDTIKNDEIGFIGIYDGFEDATSERKKTYFQYHNLGIGLGESQTLNPYFQFNVNDDPRVNPLYKAQGFLYAERYSSKQPVIYIQPGRLKSNLNVFSVGLGNMGAGIQESYIRNSGKPIMGWITSMFGAVSDIAGIAVTSFHGMFGGSKLFEFEQTYNLYKQYANYLITSLAALENLLVRGKYIGRRSILSMDTILNGEALGGSEKYINNQYLAFRVGNDVTVSESFSNSTVTNPIEEMLNNKSSENSDSQRTADSLEKVTSFNVFGLAGDKIKQAFGDIAGNASEAAVVMSGKAKAHMPDVWDSSTFSRSISLNLKFHSPYGDMVSIFENVHIPTMAILALAMPKQIGNFATAGPFYLKLHMQNKFNIEFGMIESLSITRGSTEFDMTTHGYPRTIDLSLSIKDFTPSIALPLASKGPVQAMLEAAFPSSGMSDFLGSFAGLTMKETSNFFRRIDFAKNTFSASLNVAFSTQNLASTVFNTPVIGNIYKKFNIIGPDDDSGYTASVKASRADSLANHRRQYGIISHEDGSPSTKSDSDLYFSQSEINAEATRNISQTGLSTTQWSDNMKENDYPSEQEMDANKSANLGGPFSPDSVPKPTPPPT